MKKGQIIQTLVTVCTLLGSVAVPILYIGGIKTDVAVGKSDILTLKDQVKGVVADSAQTRIDSGATRAYLEILLKNRFLIDPKTIWNDKNVPQISLITTTTPNGAENF